MTNKISLIKISAIAAALLALSACSGGSGESGHAEEGAAHAAPVSSSAGLPQGHVAAGEQLASAKGEATGQSCIDCHGAEGNAPIDATYPKLGGQYADYLAHALQQYRNGDRDHALMSSQAKSLTDQQIADLAAYFGSRESQLRDLHDVH
ncbi:c-type cytochrome [Marilutibacter chinensis]|uniref:C-type cytochrome n=1 Tax=Marilutibacter chinensis TaxID=2912247 RepID=A0ABS9HNF8_9GAMM|nr:c-type cytochrome [Lysobacter chinensis]MCF7220531.1 c-type cytochrome [Lysobacter chinensis]